MKLKAELDSVQEDFINEVKAYLFDLAVSIINL